MDMILERVQNKFACIIGELCSEPVVLSKFAIWLDLRLAEYKLKGAISLDCSGESPDPGWLKGHDKLQEPDIAEFPDHREDSSELKNRIHVSHQDSPIFSDSLSQDVVVIKEEASDNVDIFPVIIHKANTSSNVHKSRKRPSLEPSPLTASSTKKTRLNESVPSLNYTDQSGNQSLMSIIGDNGDAVAPDNDFSLLMPQSQDSQSAASFPQTMADNSGQETLVPSLSSDDSSSAVAFQSFQSSGESSFSQHTTQASDGVYDAAQPPVDESSDRWAVPASSNICLWRNTSAKPKLAADGTPLPPKAISAYSKFQSWLCNMGYPEQRSVEDIPPETLEKYLVHFFASVTRNDGQQFQTSGYKELRKYLQYYLKVSGYSESITKSPTFRHSKAVFLDKLKEIRQREFIYHGLSGFPDDQE